MFDTLSLIIEQENNNWFVVQDNECLFQNNLRHFGINQHIWNYERKEDKKNRNIFPMWKSDTFPIVRIGRSCHILITYLCVFLRLNYFTGITCMRCKHPNLRRYVKRWKQS